MSTIWNDDALTLDESRVNEATNVATIPASLVSWSEQIPTVIEDRPEGLVEG